MKDETREIIQFEIPAKNPQKLRKFYVEVFGWKFRNSAAQNMQYWIIDTGTKHVPGVTGGMYKKGSENQTLVNYIGTPDINESIKVIERAGGHITVGNKEIKGHGITAVGTDPEGNAIGLFEPADRGWFRQRGEKSQSGANRVKSSHRNDMTKDSK
jgi:hypothetical protein